MFVSETIALETREKVSILDISDRVESIAQKIHQGIVTVSSHHTTCAIAIGENEFFLKQDLADLFETLIPRDRFYQHNQLDKRPATEEDRAAIIRNNYGGFATVDEFMQNEPMNAHAHLATMMLGNSETLTVQNGRTTRGQWQSILFVDFDGPRSRKIQVTGIGFQ